MTKEKTTIEITRYRDYNRTGCLIPYKKCIVWGD